MLTSPTQKGFTTVVDMFENAVQAFPERVCLDFNDRQYTYSDINDKANQVACQLYLKGARKGDFIGLYAKKSDYYIYALLAILKLGGVYVPISREYPEKRVQFIVDDAKISFVLSDEPDANPFQSNVKIISLPVEESEAVGFPKYYGTEDDLAYLLYTSGSSGSPKGVLIHQAGFSNRIMWQKNYFQMDEEQCCLFKAPIGFDISLWEIFLPLVSGARLIVTKDTSYKNISFITSLIIQKRVSVVQFVPSLLSIFIEKISSMPSPSLSSLRRVVSSGEELTPTCIKKFVKVLPECKLYNFYGPTETSICVTAKEFDISYGDEYVSLGDPVDNVRIYLLDSNKGIITANDVEGEIYISGVCVGKGYLNLPEQTSEAFLQNHLDESPVLYKTGDKAKYVNGELVYLGRDDQFVKINGNRVELGEIRNQLNRLQYIEMSAVLVAKNKINADIIIAFYKTSEKSLDATEMKQRILNDLKLSLPQYMLPTTLIQKDSFELTDNGKIDLVKLKAEYVVP